jgi:hypothetical protein
MQIELDAFSGRPNPRWELTRAQETEFQKRLHALKKSRASAVVGDGLGYRGFVVRPNGQPVNGYDQVRLYRGTVVVRRGDHSETYSDPERGLERWLLDSARGHVDESALRRIRSDFAH